jgi:hypothetical protein
MFNYDSSRWVGLGILLSVREIHRHHAHDYLMNPSATSADWCTVQLEPAYEVMIHSPLIWICFCGALEHPLLFLFALAGDFGTQLVLLWMCSRAWTPSFVLVLMWGVYYGWNFYGSIDTYARYRSSRISGTVLSMKKKNGSSRESEPLDAFRAWRRTKRPQGRRGVARSGHREAASPRTPLCYSQIAMQSRRKRARTLFFFSQSASAARWCTRLVRLRTEEDAGGMDSAGNASMTWASMSWPVVKSLRRFGNQPGVYISE